MFWILNSHPATSPAVNGGHQHLAVRGTGDGKTEFAKTLANSASAPLYSMGENGNSAVEREYDSRFYQLTRAQRILGKNSGAVLMVDEADDILNGDAFSSSRRRRDSALAQLGLIDIDSRGTPEASDIAKTFYSTPFKSEDEVRRFLIGTPAKPTLDMIDFAHIPQAGILLKLLTSSRASAATGRRKCAAAIRLWRSWG